MKTIEQILSFKNLLRVIDAVKGGVPGGILPERMFTPSDKTDGNRGTYTKVTATRKVAQAVMYGAPSKMADHKGVSEVPVVLIHTYEHFQHDPTLVAKLRSQAGAVQKWGSEIVAKRAGQFTQRFVNLRRAAWYQALTEGKIWLDSEGNLVHRSGLAAITIDFAIPAGNKTYLNALGEGNIISASWATAATDIPNQIAGIQIAAAQLSGYPITTVYYGKNIPSYVSKNTAMKEYLKLNPTSNEAVRRGEIPDGFMQLKWRPAYTAFFEDSKGTNRRFWGDDICVFTPDESDMGWWGFIEGSYPIPTDVGQMYGDAIQALNALQTVFGLFGYAQVTNDPVGIRQYGGDTFLPVICVPKAVFIGNVTP